MSPRRPTRIPWGSGRSTKQRARKVKGQFFTPTEVVEFMFEIAGAQSGMSMVDPACGDGAFIAEAVARGCASVVGVDVDPQALALCRERVGDPAMLLEQSGLDPLDADHGDGFDLVIGNPPFNALRHGVTDAAVLSRFALGRKGDAVRPRQRLEVLFLERFIQLARPGGAVCIILPDGLLANTRQRYVREFVAESATVRAVVSLPRSTFAAGRTKAKTSVLLLEAGAPRPGEDATVVEVEDLGELAGLATRLRGTATRWLSP